MNSMIIWSKIVPVLILIMTKIINKFNIFAGLYIFTSNIMVLTDGQYYKQKKILRAINIKRIQLYSD